MNTNTERQRVTVLEGLASGQWKPGPIVDGRPTCVKCQTVLMIPGAPCPGCGISCRLACGFTTDAA